MVSENDGETPRTRVGYRQVADARYVLLRAITMISPDLITEIPHL
jgi:hypothetical protein